MIEWMVVAEKKPGQRQVVEKGFHTARDAEQWKLVWQPYFYNQGLSLFVEPMIQLPAGTLTLNGFEP